MAQDNEDKDLPLCANVDCILVKHYSLVLNCDFETTTLSGSVILDLEPQGDPEICICKSGIATDKHIDECFKLILDCQDIVVEQILEVYDEDAHSAKFSKQEHCQSLLFSCDKWSLSVRKSDVYCQHAFPSKIKVFYSTSPKGKSLLWVKDQDEKPCVYTYGAWINNRSLLPCQEPPTAMATWDGLFRAPTGTVVLTSGDSASTAVNEKDGSKEFLFSTASVLPIATLALAIGYWEVHNLKYWSSESQLEKPCCRIIAPPSLMEKTKSEIGEYLPKVLESAESSMGPYPFPRIDVLLVPPGFGSIGMASPNLIFASQSLLAGDGSLCGRVGHEVGHGWFGLLIGASDWTEEWLSEGFATFLEDVFHTGAQKCEPRERLEREQLRMWLRWRTLAAEVQETHEELQTLRPMKGETLLAEVDGTSVTLVKNGMNPEKGFLQVHYVKGYFLLKTLCGAVGEVSFIQFLKHFAEKFSGKLIQSKEFLDSYFSNFPEIVTEDFNTSFITSKWLDNPGLPGDGKEFQPSVDNELFSEAVEEAEKWKRIARSRTKRKRSVGSSVHSFKKFPVSEQLLVLLELLLEEEQISSANLTLLNKAYDLSNSNAEIRHRWCELVVKHSHVSGYKDVRRFLQDDLAMGIYLYNELFYSQQASQIRLVKECYFKVRDQLEPNLKHSIDAMMSPSHVP